MKQHGFAGTYQKNVRGCNTVVLLWRQDTFTEAAAPTKIFSPASYKGRELIVSLRHKASERSLLVGTSHARVPCDHRRAVREEWSVEDVSVVTNTLRAMKAAATATKMLSCEW